MNSKFFMSILTVLCLSLPGLALADLDSAQFLTDVHLSNMTEVEASNLALTKAQSSDVRKYAEDLIGDHRMADEMLLKVMELRGLSLIDQPASLHDQKLLTKLEKASPEKFDIVYLREMVKAHERNIIYLEGVYEQLSNTQVDLIFLVKGNLKILKEHLLDALELIGEMGETLE